MMRDRGRVRKRGGEGYREAKMDREVESDSNGQRRARVMLVVRERVIVEVIVRVMMKFIARETMMVRV